MKTAEDIASVACLLEQMATVDTPEKILALLNQKAPLLSTDLSEILGLEHQKIIGAVNSLQTFGEILKVTPISKKIWELTDEGRQIAREGSYEALVYSNIPPEGISQLELAGKVKNAKIGVSKAIQAGWIELTKTKNGPWLIRKVSKIEDVTRNVLNRLLNNDEDSVSNEEKNELKKRKLLSELSIKSLLINKGIDFTVELIRPEADLNAKNLMSGDWRTKKFKEYNFNALGMKPKGGYLHPLLKVRQEYRQIFLEMGYSYDWKLEEATKNVLRTHTTGTSARMLHKLAQGPFQPVKYFSIDRVFRNENLDATHLAEFHQIEGVVADRGLSLGHHIGILKEFFRKLGIEKLKFKPAYNPYTEPSMEVFGYHDGLQKWVEIGNSGVFRPELLLPMGLPPDVTVLGWGLSLESEFLQKSFRPTMIKYGIENIRDLIGPRVNLRMVQCNAICRVNK